MSACQEGPVSASRVIDIVRSKEDKKFTPYQEMANTIIAYTLRYGLCEPKYFIQNGYFSREHVNRYWHLANEMARIELKILGLGNVASFEGLSL